MDILQGSKTNALAADALVHALTALDINGTLYIGYPIVASADDHVLVDALLTCEEFGVVAFDLQSPADHDALEARQDAIHAALMQRLIAFKPLRAARQLAFPIQIFSFVPGPIGIADIGNAVVNEATVKAFLERDCQPISHDLLRSVDSAIQRVTSIKPQRKRLNVRQAGSKGAVIKEIEAQIATLDQWQKTAAIEMPEGPQRIRGLAGSGKTIVLALKAAYLHTLHPDWTIAVTFHTRSLYQQFTDLIRRFTFEHIADEPDWNRLRVLHSWGAPRRPGLYSEICRVNGTEPIAFGEAKARWGSLKSFKGVCEELVKTLTTNGPAEQFDAVLVDEAQDLPQAFFELIYMSAKKPKRLVWAYDELQNLSEYAMVPPSELFGTENGQPRVPELHNIEGNPRQDVVLPICYRNTPWALTVAHALGFGLYRKRGMVQFFDDPGLLLDVGYERVAGVLEPGHDVTIRRSKQSAPEYFDQLLNRREVIRGFIFKSNDEQAKWVANEIQRNLTTDELEPRDILVIVTDPINAQKQAAPIMHALAARSIPCHLAGVTSSRDELFTDESVAISGIYRAKGHEAAVVYVVNSEYGEGLVEVPKRRNILFTAITRSRAWINVCGVGVSMNVLVPEVQRVIDEDYALSFRVPTEMDLKKMRRIHRDRSPQEVAAAQKGAAGLKQFLDSVRDGSLEVESLPEDMRRDLKKLISRSRR